MYGSELMQFSVRKFQQHVAKVFGNAVGQCERSVEKSGKNRAYSDADSLWIALMLMRWVAYVGVGVESEVIEPNAKRCAWTMVSGSLGPPALLHVSLMFASSPFVFDRPSDTLHHACTPIDSRGA